MGNTPFTKCRVSQCRSSLDDDDVVVDVNPGRGTMPSITKADTNNKKSAPICTMLCERPMTK
eukprot:scaffold2353_cov167-Amphora_coffeaeformis.AAC.72